MRLIYFQDIFDLTGHIQIESPKELTSALEDNMSVTRNLVTKIVQLGGNSNSKVLQDTAFIECQKAKTEVIRISTFSLLV